MKSALNERFRRYQRLSISLENELCSLKTQKPSETKIEPLKNTYESQYYKATYELGNLRAQLESQEKKTEMLKYLEETKTSEFLSFKTIYTKELMLTKYDLEEVTKQRNLLRDQLIEFKTFFNNISKFQ